MTLKKTLYKYINMKKKYKVIKNITTYRSKKKIENGCASKVFAVGSSIELSSLLSFSELFQVPTASEVDDLLLP